MRVEIIRGHGLIRNDLSREVYTLTVRPDGKLLLCGYRVERRETTRHKWRTFGATFDSWSSRGLSRSDVVVPESVIADALADIRGQYEAAGAAVKWSPE